MLAMATEMSSTPRHGDGPGAAHNVREVQRADCCIVGAGPAGAVLALLLARRGISVLLLEAHGDFEREFRGDTIHPSVMEIMEALGLADRLLEMRHTKIRSLTIQTDDGPATIADFSRLKTPYPFITLLPQARFLEFVTGEARRLPHFRLVMGAHVRELIDEDGAMRGVRYLGRDGWYEARALLTVGADGRFSRIRQVAGLEPIATSAPMDVLWFRLPRRPDDPEGAIGVFRPGRILVFLDRSDHWQVGYVFPKGGYQKLRAGGVEALRRSIAELVPQFADRVEVLKEWTQVSLLSVESNRLRRWYRPGLLLIGDAAHVMSPVGGVGINYAIQDAVVAANVLAGPLKAGRVRLEDLAMVQRRREWPTRIIQAFQNLIQRRLVSGALGATQPFRLPMVLRLILSLPILRNLPGRLIGLGVWRVHVEN
jgi:2-polyprenyl-6-methoxyphenol hydroxylase-like FAD-dependent oxidoreductase